MTCKLCTHLPAYVTYPRDLRPDGTMSGMSGDPAVFDGLFASEPPAWMRSSPPSPNRNCPVQSCVPSTRACGS